MAIKQTKIPNKDVLPDGIDFFPAFTDNARAQKVLAGMAENTAATTMNALIGVGHTMSAITSDGEKFYTKVGYDEYVDAATGIFTTSRHITRDTVGKQWRRIDARQMLDRLDSMGVLKGRTKHIELDIETKMFQFDKYNPSAKDIAEIGWASINANTGGVGNKTRVMMFDLLRKNLNIVKDEGIEKLRIDLGAGKTAEQDFINKFTKLNDVSRGVAKNYANLLKHMKKSVAGNPRLEKRIMNMVRGKLGHVGFKMAPGQTTVMASVDGIGPFMRKVAANWERQIKSGDLRVMSFNPSGLDQSVMDELLREEGRRGKIELSLGDSRGIALMQRAMQFPQTGMSFYYTNDTLIRPVLDRLGVAGQARNEVVDNIIRGVSSRFAKGSDVESLYNMVRDYHGKKYIAEAHDAIGDVMMTADMLKGHKRITKQIVENIHDPKQFSMSPRLGARVSYLKQLIWRNIENTPAGRRFMNSRGVSDPHAFYKFFDKATNMQEIKNTMERMTMDAADRKFGRTLLKDTRAQFGAGNINSFLAGAFGAGFTIWSVQKYMARLAEQRRSEPDGLSHNSIPTIIRRIQMTDFGSGRVLGNWTTAAYPVVRAFFTETRQRGLGKTVGNLLGGINAYIKHGLRRGDAEEILAAREKMWGSVRVIGEKFHKLIFGDSNIGKSVTETIRGATASATNMVSKFKRWWADPYISKEITESMMQKWRDIPVATKMIMGGGLAAGVAGSMLLNTMKGDYDPRYDYEDYIERDRSKPRNYMKSLRGVRAVRHARDAMNTRMTDQESTNRALWRRQHSDFGSGVRPLITGMKTEKLSLFWSSIRNSLEEAFKMTKNVTRRFKTPGTARVSGAMRKGVNLRGLPAAANRSASTALVAEGLSQSKDMHDMITRAVPPSRVVFNRKVRPSHMGPFKSLDAKYAMRGFKADTVGSAALAAGDRKSFRLPLVESMGGVVAGEFAPISSYDRMRDTFGVKFTEAIEQIPLKVPDMTLHTPKNILRSPKSAQEGLRHAIMKAKYPTTRTSTTSTRAILDADVGTDVIRTNRENASLGKITQGMGDRLDKGTASFVSKGDQATLDKLLAEADKDVGARYLKEMGFGNRVGQRWYRADMLRNEVSQRVNQLTVDYQHYFGKRYYGRSLPPYNMWELHSNIPASLF